MCPNSLLCEVELFHIRLRALSIPHFIHCWFVTWNFHVPAHALVQAGVDLGEVWRRLAVHKGGHFQPSNVALTNVEVRNAGKVERRARTITLPSASA